MTLTIDLACKDGRHLAIRSVANSMSIGHEDFKERKTGTAVERFDFPFFNNMDFHTEFVRRFYRQMLFEALDDFERERAFPSPD